MYSIYLLMSDLLSFIMSYTDKREFSSIWKWIRCCNDVMNNDCVIKGDVYPQKMHSDSKNIRGISVFSSTGRRPASLCHGLLSVVRPCVRLCVNFFFKHLLL